MVAGRWRPDEPGDPEITRFYERFSRLPRRAGEWRLLECREAWSDNPTWERFVAFAWTVGDWVRSVVAVNYGPTQGQCFVALPPSGPPGTAVRFRDLLGPAVYDRETDDLSTRGLYLDLLPWGYHVFEVEGR